MKKPYLPLFVSSFMSNAALADCSPAANGVYIRVMCILHAQPQYGILSLEPSETQSPIEVIVSYLSRHLPWSVAEITPAIVELTTPRSSGAHPPLTLSGYTLSQARMIADAAKSAARSGSGSKGGRATQAAISTLRQDQLPDYMKKPAAPVQDPFVSHETQLQQLILPFSTDTFRQEWIQWLQWRQATHGKTYPNTISHKAALDQLRDYSAGIEATAISIIQKAIASRWQHLYPPDQSPFSKPKPIHITSKNPSEPKNYSNWS